MEQFGKHTIINREKYDMIMIDIYKKEPTSLQWIFFMENLKETISYFKTNNRKFGFVFNIEKLGGIPNLKYIKEYSDFFRKNEDLLEKNLICSCVFNNSNIIRTIWDITMKVYTSKKEIIFINMDQEPHNVFDEKL